MGLAPSHLLVTRGVMVNTSHLDWQIILQQGIVPLLKAKLDASCMSGCNLKQCQSGCKAVADIARVNISPAMQYGKSR